jgi:hypothetical protein
LPKPPQKKLFKPDARILNNFELRSLQKKLELMAGFRIGAERFSFSVNPNSDKSWWNFKTHTIQVGIKDIPEKKVDLLAGLLMVMQI